MLPEGLLQTAHLAHVDAYLSCSSHCCHQYPTRNCLRVEGLLLLAYGSRETFYSQPGNGSEQKVGTSYQTPKACPWNSPPSSRAPLPEVPIPSPVSCGPNIKHRSQWETCHIQITAVFNRVSGLVPRLHTVLCWKTRMQCSLAESMNLVILSLIFQKCSLHTFIPPCASGCC